MLNRRNETLTVILSNVTPIYQQLENGWLKFHFQERLHEDYSQRTVWTVLCFTVGNRDENHHFYFCFILKSYIYANIVLFSVVTAQFKCVVWTKIHFQFPAAMGSTGTDSLVFDPLGLFGMSVLRDCQLKSLHLL